jgi:hypothetical protein
MRFQRLRLAQHVMRACLGERLEEALVVQLHPFARRRLALGHRHRALARSRSSADSILRGEDRLDVPPRITFTESPRANR